MTVIRQMVELSTLQLSYLEWNPEGPRPILFLHGMGDHAGVWSNLAAQLGPQFHGVAPDLRGHGESVKPAAGYTFADMLTDLTDLVSALGWSQIIAVGHSWGAKCLLRWAQTSPDLFESLILVDPFFNGQLPKIVEITYPLMYRVLPFLSGMGPYPSREAAAEHAQTLNQYQGWSEHQQQVFQGAIEQKADGQWGTKFSIAARNGIFAASVAESGITQTVDLPTVLIRPEKGLNKRAWQLTPYRRYLPHLTLHTVPGNHWPFLSAANTFNPRILDILGHL